MAAEYFKIFVFLEIGYRVLSGQPIRGQHPCLLHTLVFPQPTYGAIGAYPNTIPLAMTPFLFLTLIVPLAAGIDCYAEGLQQYDFQSIKGIYSDSFLRSTPPSKSTYSWSIGICQDLDGQNDCPEKTDICGTKHVQVDDKDVLSEVVAFNSDLKREYTPFSNDKESGVNVYLKNLAWGDALVDANIRFICAEGSSPDMNKLKIEKWDGRAFEGKFPTPAACVRDNKKNPPKSKVPNEDGGESWGWFTWIFIFMVLFLSIYIIGGAWFQYNKGNSIDFQSALKEVLENFIDLLRGLPSFAKEIVEKVTGNSSRNEYSAV